MNLISIRSGLLVEFRLLRPWRGEAIPANIGWVTYNPDEASRIRLYREVLISLPTN